MKKIGILSMQRVKNYGSFLQAFGLKKMLENLDDTSVCFVDFETKNGIVDHAVNSMNNLKKNKVRYLLMKTVSVLGYLPCKFGLFKNGKVREIVNLFKFYHLFCSRFANEFWKVLGLSNEQNIRPKLDMIVIGSDEVFNYKEAQKAGYSDELFGNGLTAKRLIAFSGCFGCTTMSDLNQMGAVGKITDYLNGFSAISVRDKHSQSIVNELTHKECEYLLDPVLYCDYTDLLPKIKVDKPYIAVYAYSGMEPEIKQKISDFAKDNNLDILCFMGYQGSFWSFMDVSPFELLSYIINSAYVVTNTFHGSVFAIKYNKPFCTLVRHRIGEGYGNNEKVGDLLGRLNLTSHITDNPEQMAEILTDEIDYAPVNDYIEKSRKTAIYYLENQVCQLSDNK